MENKYYDIRVDIEKGDVIKSGHVFTQGDSADMFLRIAVMDGKRKFDATGANATIVFKKEDGTIVTGIPYSSGDVWIYKIQGTELSCPGKVTCDIKFNYESGRISSGKFSYIVERDTLSGANSAAGSYITEFEKIMRRLEGAKAIREVIKKKSEGLVDIYKIVFTDDSEREYIVTNGRGIIKSSKKTNGLKDIYTLEYNDGTSDSIELINGRGIKEVKVKKNGLLDSYTIIYNDDTSYSFSVKNARSINKIEKTDEEDEKDIYSVLFNDGTESKIKISNGCRIFRGTEVSGKSIKPTVFAQTGIEKARVNDIFINYEEGAFYHCTKNGDENSAEWVYDFTFSGGSGSGGIKEYPDLEKKPQINGKILQGNLEGEELGLISYKTGLVVKNSRLCQRFIKREE